MTNEQIMGKIAEFESILPDIKKALAGQPENKDLDISAKKYLLNILSKPFEVKVDVNNCLITYYQDGDWVFQQDFKNKLLWYYYDKFWLVFESKYSMTYQKIEALLTEVVGQALNCKDFTFEGFPIIKYDKVG